MEDGIMREMPTNQKPGFCMRHLLLAMFLSVALVGCSDESTPEKQTAADVRAGKVVADKECKGCHGLDGKGTAAGIPNLAGQRGRYIMAALQEYKEGKRVHAALRTIAADLNEEQTRGVAAYYASLPPIPAVKEPVFLSLRDTQHVARRWTRPPNSVRIHRDHFAASRFFPARSSSVLVAGS